VGGGKGEGVVESSVGGAGVSAGVDEVCGAGGDGREGTGGNGDGAEGRKDEGASEEMFLRV